MTAKELTCASTRCPDERREGLAYITQPGFEHTGFLSAVRLGQAEAHETKESNIPNLSQGRGQPSRAVRLGRSGTLRAPSVGRGRARIGSGVIKLFILPAPKAASTLVKPRPSLNRSEKEGNKQ